MPGSSNFQPWNPSAANQEDDAAYLIDAARTGGAGTGSEFDSPTANKLFYQTSIMTAALAGMLANKGFTVSDADLPTLEAVLAHIVTTADQRVPLIGLAFSPAPAYDAATYSGWQMTLTGNLTTPTVAGLTAGQQLLFIFIQDATGGRTVAWPAGFNQMPGVDSTPNSVTVITAFVSQDGATVYGLGTQAITGSINIPANGGGIGSNTSQLFVATLSSPVPSGRVVDWSLAQGSGPISGSGGVIVQVVQVNGADVTVQINNAWNSTQGWNAFTLNFRVL